MSASPAAPGAAPSFTRGWSPPIGMFLEFDNGVRTTRIRDVQLIRGGDGREH